MPTIPWLENGRLEIFIQVNWVKSDALSTTSKQEADIVGAVLNLGLNVVPWRGSDRELIKLNKAGGSANG